MVEQEPLLVVHLLVVLVVVLVMDTQLAVCLVDLVVHMEIMEVVVHPLQPLKTTLVEEAVVPVL